jgi:hypothetical protein
MKGRSEVFQLAGEAYTLQRPSFSEMPGIVERIDSGEVVEILSEAVGSEYSDKLEKALESADHEDVTTLWDEYKTFMGYQAFLDNWLAPREREQAKRQAVMFTAMKEQGLVSETMFEDIMERMMLPSEAGTTSTALLTDGLPN